jgi:hypothetical protein
VASWSSFLFVDDVIVGSTISSIIRSSPISTAGGAGGDSDETYETSSAMTTSSTIETETSASRRNLSRISFRMRVTSSILALRLFPVLLAKNASVVTNPAAPH